MTGSKDTGFLFKRIGGLDDIRAAAGPLAGRKKDKALRPKRFYREAAPRGEVIRDGAGGHVPQARQRHVRQKLARFRRQADPPQPPLLISLQVDQLSLGLDPDDDGARLVAAEPAQALEAHVGWRTTDLSERLGDIARGR